MKKPIALAVAAGSLALLSLVPQKRASQDKPSFEKCLETASSAWNAGDYGTCMTQLKAGMGIVVEKQVEALLAAFPAAPEGWEAQPQKRQNAQANPFAAAMASSVGTIVEHRYKGPERNQQLDLTLTADSPLVSMFGMMLNNPAMLQADGGELIEYNEHKAMLKKTGRGYELQVMIWGKHMLQANLTGADDKFLFSVLDQKAIDKLAAQLGR